MCNKNWIIFGIIHINGAFATALALCIAAAAASASFFGAPGAVPLMIAASAVVAGALASLAAYYAALESYYNCMSAKLPANTPCSVHYSTARGTLEAAMAFTILLLAACSSVSVVAWIPFTAAAAIVGITYSFSVIMGLLITANVAVGRLISCLESQRAKYKISLTATNIKILSCPLNKSMCSDQDLKEFAAGTSGTYITSPSFAINLKSSNPRTIASLRAKVTDSFSNTVSIDSAQIFSPNTHTIGAKDGWVVRLDWMKLSGDGLRIEISQRRWVVTMDVTYNDATKAVETVTCDVAN